MLRQIAAGPSKVRDVVNASLALTQFVEIDVRGLNVVKGRPGVFLIPNEGPLDLTGRIASWGANG
jgi:hypothetical protein